MENQLFIKRDDLIPFSFGGNKARKAMLFWEDIKEKDVDYIVTYGSSHSNHCRIIANLASSQKLKCIIISPRENEQETFNRKMMKLFKAEMISCSLNEVRHVIENTLEDLRARGYKPYFIPGGGHGNIGTQAYVACYEEIRNYERENGIFFDYIFHASGTGTTQAGLVSGQLLHNDCRKIVGISIARRVPYGRDVVIASIEDYLAERKVNVSKPIIEENTVFIDDYICGGYGIHNSNILNSIKILLEQYGIYSDSIYTGKAFGGMGDYVRTNHIRKKNILFLHTGSSPLFFDDLKDWE